MTCFTFIAIIRIGFHQGCRPIWVLALYGMFQLNMLLPTIIIFSVCQLAEPIILTVMWFSCSLPARCGRQVEIESLSASVDQLRM